MCEWWCDDVQMDVEGVEKLQGQKMRAYTEYKKRMSAEVYRWPILPAFPCALCELSTTSWRASADTASNIVQF